MATDQVPRLAIELPREASEEFCRRWKVTELALFGAILDEDFGPDDEIEFLVTFVPEARWRLLDLASTEFELADLLGHEVTITTRCAVERSDNPFLRREILASSQPFSAAGRDDSGRDGPGGQTDRRVHQRP